MQILQNFGFHFPIFLQRFYFQSSKSYKTLLQTQKKHEKNYQHEQIRTVTKNSCHVLSRLPCFGWRGMATNKRDTPKDMRYLVTLAPFPPFLTNWYDYENHWKEGMTIYDRWNQTYTTDGKTWLEIEKDQL